MYLDWCLSGYVLQGIFNNNDRIKSRYNKGLVTNYGEGGCKKGGGGWHVNFDPYEKGGGRKGFSHVEGGQQVLGYFFV